MKNIAFKRAKHDPAATGIFPPEYIIEYKDDSLFPEGYHKREDGYEILTENIFELELQKNPRHLIEYIEQKKQDELDKQQVLTLIAQQEEAKERQDEREYEEFLRWKKMKSRN